MSPDFKRRNESGKVVKTGRVKYLEYIMRHSQVIFGAKMAAFNNCTLFHRQRALLLLPQQEVTADPSTDIISS